MRNWLMVSSLKTMWVTIILHLPESAFSLHNSTFQAVCGNSSVPSPSSVSPLKCAVHCASAGPSCRGFTFPPCELSSAEGPSSCEAGRQRYKKRITSSDEAATTQAFPVTTVKPNPCPAPFAYAASVHSCYTFHPTTAASTPQDLQSVCAGLHPSTHLIAIETSDEHQQIHNIPGNDGSCKYIWTGGFTSSPQTGQTSEWMWDLGMNSVPMTFSAWWADGPQPDNSGGIETRVLVDRDISYEFLDVPADLSGNAWFITQTLCYVCEYDP